MPIQLNEDNGGKILAVRVSGKLAKADYGLDPECPLGHGRAIYIWSFIVALMLFGMDGLFSISEGMHKMGSGQPLENPWIAVGVLPLLVAVFVGIEVRALLAENVSAPAMIDCERALRAAFPQVRWMFFGPDAQP